MPFVIIFLFLVFSSPAVALPVLFSQDFALGKHLPSYELITVNEPVLQLKIGNGAIQFQQKSVFRILSDQPVKIEIISGDVQVFLDDKTPVTFIYDEKELFLEAGTKVQLVAGDNVSGQVYHGKMTIAASNTKKDFSTGQKFSITQQTAQAELESLGAIAPAAGGEGDTSSENTANTTPLNNQPTNNQINNQVAADLALLSAQQDFLNRSGNDPVIPDGDDGDDGARPLYPPTAIELQGTLKAGSNHRTFENAQSDTFAISRKNIEFDDQGMPKRITEDSSVWFWNDYVERVTARIADAQGNESWQVGRITDGTVLVADTFAPEALKERTLSRNQGLHYALGDIPENIPTEGVAVYELAAATRPTYVDGSTAPGNVSGNLTVNFSGFIPTIGINLMAVMPDATWHIVKDVNSMPSDVILTSGPSYGQFMFGADVTGDACQGEGRKCFGQIAGSLVGNGAPGAALTYEAVSGILNESGTIIPDRQLGGAGYFNRIP